MKNSLQEQFSLLVNYNPKLTLTENLEIKEDAISKVITDVVRDGKIAISDVARNWMKELPVVKSSGKSFEDFLLGFGGLNKASKTKFVESLLKDTSMMRSQVRADATVTKLINQASESLSKQLKSGGGELGREFKKLKTIPEQKLFLKKKGYRMDVINNIFKDEKLIANVGKESSTVVKDALKQESHIVKFKDKFKEYYNNGKGRISDLKKKDWVKKGFLKKTGGLGRPIKWVISKRKILAWAAVAGVTYWILKNWLSSQEIDETDDNNGGGTGGGTVYTNCTTFPYKKGCQNSAISEVQDCLGLTTDGKFGPKTEDALVAKGYGKEITQDVYNKVKANCGGSTISTTTTTTINPATNYDLTNVDASDASSLFK